MQRYVSSSIFFMVYAKTLPSSSVLSTLYTSDARFILSGSDDGNVRLWKANSHDRLGVMDTRERNAIEYRDALKQRWKFDTEVGKVLRYVQTFLYRIMTEFRYLNQELDLFLKQSRLHPSLSTPCWMQPLKRKIGEGSIHGREKQIQERREKSLSSLLESERPINGDSAPFL